MKKVKVTVNEGSEGRTLFLFPDAESAYVWVSEGFENPDIIDQIEDIEEIILLPGEHIEVEWRGCEFVYHGQDHVKLDFVRFAKFQPTQNASGAVVSIYVGWVADCIIPFRNFKDDDVTVKLIENDEQTIDLAILFKDEKPEEK